MMATMPTLWGTFITDGLIHTAPCNESGAMTQGHIESMLCWCAPSLESICPNCRGKGENCWKCGGDGVIAGSVEDPRRVSHVIHRNFDADHD